VELCTQSHTIPINQFCEVHQGPTLFFFVGIGRKTDEYISGIGPWRKLQEASTACNQGDSRFCNTSNGMCLSELFFEIIDESAKIASIERR
jgi:hypothetical protein